jgi:hypothetical protein
MRVPGLLVFDSPLFPIDQSMRAWPPQRKFVCPVDQPAFIEGKTPTADAIGKSIAQFLELMYPRVQFFSPSLGHGLPVFFGGWLSRWKAGQRVTNGIQGNPKILSDFDYCHSP